MAWWEIKLAKNHGIILQQTNHYFDKQAVSPSLTGHTRQTDIIITCNNWLTVQRPHIDQRGTKQHLQLVVTNCHPGICRWESTALRAGRSATFVQCSDTSTHRGALCEALLSKIKIRRDVCLRLKLIGSHLHSDLLAKWLCQLVSAAASPRGTLLERRHGRHPAPNPQTQHLNLSL